MTRYQTPAEEQPEDTVDAYLTQRFGFGLEQALLDAINKQTSPSIVGMVTINVNMTARWHYTDGGLAEHFAGTFTLLGTIYEFRCCAYSVPSANIGRFLSEVSRFEPIAHTSKVSIVK